MLCLAERDKDNAMGKVRYLLFLRDEMSAPVSVLTHRINNAPFPKNHSLFSGKRFGK